MSFKDTKEGETHFVCAKHSREDGEEAECCGCTRVSTQCSFVPDDYNPMTNQPIEEKWNWHEEFDKMRHAKGPFIVSSEAVKAFIENLLEQERKRMSDEIEKKATFHEVAVSNVEVKTTRMVRLDDVKAIIKTR